MSESINEPIFCIADFFDERIRNHLIGKLFRVRKKWMELKEIIIIIIMYFYIAIHITVIDIKASLS